MSWNSTEDHEGYDDMVNDCQDEVHEFEPPTCPISAVSPISCITPWCGWKL